LKILSGSLFKNNSESIKLTYWFIGNSLTGILLTY